MTSVNVQPRDIIFTFPDSCNCCTACCKKPITEETPVYVNHKGKLEKYTAAKAKHNDELAFLRSMTHLYQTITRKVDLFKGNQTEFQHRVAPVTDSMGASRTITLAHVESVNNLMLEFLKESSEDSNSK